MNINTLSPSAKLIRNFVMGENQPQILVLVCGENLEETKKHALEGIVSAGGSYRVMAIPEFSELDKISPLTANYAKTYMADISKFIDNLLEQKLYDGVLIISNNLIGAVAAINSCVNKNIPTTVLSGGYESDTLERFLSSVGAETCGKITSAALKELTLTTQKSNSFTEKGIANSLIYFLENLGLAVKDASKSPANSPKQRLVAFEAGKQVAKTAKNQDAIVKLITKENVVSAASKMAKNGFNLFALTYLNFVDFKKVIAPLIKEKNSQIKTVSGVCDAFIQTSGATSTVFSGSVWAYEDLTSADVGLASGAVDGGVLVIKNSAGVDVSQIQNVIKGFGIAEKFFVLTSGVAEVNEVATLCMASEDIDLFETGDVIEIDLNKGKISSSISARDLKLRAKRKR
ncbi:MAG: dihydroxy-acid dehydratase [Christensenellaceae bacterium]|nr:dihydroxy-acid dehydratase [Christensenellaceae bacterium]